MSIYDAVVDSCMDLREEAAEILATSQIPDSTFIKFVKGLGDMKWLPFPLPQCADQETVLLWMKGVHIPSQEAKRTFVEYFYDQTHPSLI